MKTFVQTILIIMTGLGFFFLTGCSNPSDSASSVGYAIGDIGPSGVGKVFYITDGGLHGLEAAPRDQRTAESWSTIINVSIGTTGTAIGTGSDNTDAIINQSGHSYSAAQVCRDYHGGGLTDWFLPSKDELHELYQNKTAVGGFADSYYWSSSEIDSKYAWHQYFFSDIQDSFNKYYERRVRAIRAF